MTDKQGTTANGYATVRASKLEALYDENRRYREALCKIEHDPDIIKAHSIAREALKDHSIVVFRLRAADHPDGYIDIRWCKFCESPWENDCERCPECIDANRKDSNG